MKKTPGAFLVGLRLHDAEGIHLSQTIEVTHPWPLHDGREGKEDQAQVYTGCVEEELSQ